ncbi:MAG: hypothetical protein VX424_06240 [Actinomycetota bacterium]|nr:hypothetical protein [Actinomycetota bacterium]
MAQFIRLGDDRVSESEKHRLKISGDFMLVPNEAGHSLLPRWVELETKSRGEPSEFARVEIRDGVPRLVELHWKAAQGQREIRQKDLRGRQVSTYLDDVYRQAVIQVRDGQPLLNIAGMGSTQDRKVREVLEEARAATEGKPRKTAEFLQQVAAVYKANPAAPTAAVARTFGVKIRQASNYVDSARERGLLAPTTQGKASV